MSEWEWTYDIAVNKERGDREQYALRYAPQQILESLAAAIARELGDRAAIRGKYPSGYQAELKAALKTKAANVKASMAEIREIQRTIFVISDDYPHVDTAPEL